MGNVKIGSKLTVPLFLLVSKTFGKVLYDQKTIFLIESKILNVSSSLKIINTVYHSHRS